MNSSGEIVVTPDYGWSSAVAEGSHTYLDPVVLRALRTIDPRSERPMRIFDAGCGNGALLRTLAKTGYSVAGCDASASGIQHIRQHGQTLDARHMSVYDDMSASFGNQWDVVIATEVIEHLYSPRDFVRQAVRLLKPEGHMVLTTPYHGYFKNLVMSATGMLDAHFTALWDGGHIKFWSYRTLCQLLREFNFGDFRFLGAGRCVGLWKSMVVTARLNK